MAKEISGSRPKRKIRPKPEPKPSSDSSLQGWNAIAKFLGQTAVGSPRWHESGMPVEYLGRRVSGVPEELRRWVGTDAGKSKPVHIAREQETLLADLTEGLAYVRRRGKDDDK